MITAPDTTIETTCGVPAKPVTITVRGGNAYMHDPTGGAYCSAVKLDGKTITSMTNDGWYWTDPTTRRAWESAGFTFAAPAWRKINNDIMDCWHREAAPGSETTRCGRPIPEGAKVPPADLLGDPPCLCETCQD